MHAQHRQRNWRHGVQSWGTAILRLAYSFHSLHLHLSISMSCRVVSCNPMQCKSLFSLRREPKTSLSMSSKETLKLRRRQIKSQGQWRRQKRHPFAPIRRHTLSIARCHICVKYGILPDAIDFFIDFVFFGEVRVHQHRHPRHMQPEKLLFMLPPSVRPLSFSAPSLSRAFCLSRLRQAQAFSRSGRSVRTSSHQCLVPTAAWRPFAIPQSKAPQSNQQPNIPSH